MAEQTRIQLNHARTEPLLSKLYEEILPLHAAVPTNDDFVDWTCNAITDGTEEVCQALRRFLADLVFENALPGLVTLTGPLDNGLLDVDQDAREQTQRRLRPFIAALHGLSAASNELPHPPRSELLSSLIASLHAVLLAPPQPAKLRRGLLSFRTQAALKPENPQKTTPVKPNAASTTVPDNVDCGFLNPRLKAELDNHLWLCFDVFIDHFFPEVEDGIFEPPPFPATPSERSVVAWFQQCYDSFRANNESPWIWRASGNRPLMHESTKRKVDLFMYPTQREVPAPVLEASPSDQPADTLTSPHGNGANAPDRAVQPQQGGPANSFGTHPGPPDDRPRGGTCRAAASGSSPCGHSATAALTPRADGAGRAKDTDPDDDGPDGTAEDDGRNHRADQAEWSKVLVVGELKPEKGLGDLREKVVIQLASYAYDVFASQPRRRFVDAFTVINATMRCWIFTRASGMASEQFDLHHGPGLRKFKRVFAGYFSQTAEGLGLPFTYPCGDDGGGGFADVEIGGTTVTVNSDAFFQVPAIVTRGTTCYAVTESPAEDPQDSRWVLKEAWRWDADQMAEGDMLQLCAERGVEGVATHLCHDALESVHRIVGPCVSNAVRLNLKWRRQRKSSPYRVTATESAAKRSQSNTGAAVVAAAEQQQQRPAPARSPGSLFLGTGFLPAVSGKRKARADAPDDEPEQYWEYEAETGTGGPVRSFLPNRIDTRTVISRGTPVRDITFSSAHTLLACIRDAVRGHRSLFEKARILHRDVSTNNVMLTTHARADGYAGFLIDLDLATATTYRPSGAPKRTGTYEFMSIEMLKGGDGFVHTYLDDLQSFFYVFLYLCHRREQRAAVFEKWAVLDPVDCANNKFAVVTNAYWFGDLVAGFDTALGDVVKDVAYTLREVMWPHGKMWDRTRVADEHVRVDVYDTFVEALQEGAENARRLEATTVRE